MKTFLKFTVLSAVLLMLAGGFVSCNRDDDKPPQFYFEAYINGQRFVNGMPGFQFVQVWYFPQQNSLSVVGVSGDLGVSIFIYDVFDEGKHDFVHLHFSPMLNWQDVRVSDNAYSWVNITEFDSGLGQTVAGTFQFIGTFPIIDRRTGEYTSEYKELKITEGRFRSANLMYSFSSSFDSSSELLHYLTQSRLLKLQTP